MANEREITIKISAKNLTAEGFAKAKSEILGLDQASGKAAGSGVTLGGAFSAAAIGATAIAAAVGVGVAALTKMTGVFVDLAQHGASVADIRQQFDVLNRSTGNVSSTILGTLRTALRGTVSDFEIMKSTNGALSQGLKLTEGQFDLTAKASRVLADRVGGDTAGAYDKLITAMATGQDRTLKEIGLNIDAEAAVKRYADALGLEVGQLSEAEKTGAKRQAMLEALEQTLRVSGEAEVDFADLVDQGKAALANWRDELAEGVASSPVLGAAFTSIGDAVRNAFGPSQGDLIKMIIRGIEEAAVITIQAGSAAVGMAESMTRGFFTVRNTLLGMVASVKEGIASLPMATDAMKASAEEWRAKANESERDGQLLTGMFANLRAGLDKTVVAMREAQAQQREQGKTSTEQAGRTRDLAAAEMMLGDARAERGRKTKQQEATEKEHQKLLEKGKDLADEILLRERLRRISGEDLMKTIKAGNVALHNEVDSLARVETSHFGVLQSSTTLANGMMAGLHPAVASTTEELKKLHNAGDSVTKSLSKAFSDLPRVIQSALQGGGDLGKSVGALFGSQLFSEDSGLTKSFTGGVTKLFSSDRIGKAIGAMLPGLGTILGQFGGQLAGKLFGGLFKGEGKQVNNARDEFTALNGGIDALAEKAAAAGLSLKRMYDAKTMAQLKAAMDEINAAVGQNAADHDLARQAMEEWGISAQEAGQKFAQADMDETAGRMLKMLKAATSQGVDLNAIVEKGGDDFGAMVRQAIRTGTTISDEFKPVIAAMIANGTLIDENGQKFADLSEVPFGTTITGAVEDVAAALRELKDFFLNGVTGAFASAAGAGEDFARRVYAGVRLIPTKIDIEVNGHYNAPDIEGGSPGYAVGTLGRHGSYFANFREGTNIRAHGYEAILTPEQAPGFVATWLARNMNGAEAVAGGSPAAPNVYVLVEKDGAARAVSETEFQRRKMNALLRTGLLQVPLRAVGSAV